MNKLITIVLTLIVIGAAVQTNKALTQFTSTMMQLNNVANAQTK